MTKGKERKFIIYTGIGCTPETSDNIQLISIIKFDILSH